jgi:hypothetical protein
MAVLDAKHSAAAVNLCSAAWYCEMKAIPLSALHDGFNFNRSDARLATTASAEGPDSSACDSNLWAAPPSGSSMDVLAAPAAEFPKTKSLREGLWWTAGLDHDHNRVSRSPHCPFAASSSLFLDRRIARRRTSLDVRNPVSPFGFSSTAGPIRPPR